MDILGLPGPAQQPAPMVSTRGTANGTDNLPGFVRVVERMAKRIDSVQSEYGREIYRSVMEKALARATNNLVTEIPSQEDLALRRQQREVLRLQLNKQEATAKTEMAFDSFLRLDPKIKARYGVTDDAINTDPMAILKVVNGEGLTAKPLTTSDLFHYGIDTEALTPEGQARTQARAAAKEQAAAMEGEKAQLALTEARARHLPTMAEQRGKEAEIVAQTQEGEGVYGAILKDTKRQVEESTGTDLTASVLGPDVDSDEPRGAIAELSNYDLGFQKVSATGDVPPAIYADVWRAQSWDRIKDQLEEFEPDETGGIPVGAGHTGLNPDAQPFLIGSVLRYARDKNIDINRAFTELELPFRYSKETQAKLVRDLALWGVDYAKRSGQDPAQIINTLLGEEVVTASGQMAP